VPDELYRHQQHGFEANDEVLTALQATLPEHGKYYLIGPRWSRLMYYRLRCLSDY
jgi:hypothetical protein